MSEEPPHIPSEGEQLPEEPSQPIGVWHGPSGDFPVLEILGEDEDPDGNKFVKVRFYSIEVEDGVEVRKEHESFAPSSQVEIYPEEPAGEQESFTQALWRKSEAEPSVPVVLLGHQQTYLGEKYWARLPDGTEDWLSAEEIDLAPAVESEKDNVANENLENVDDDSIGASDNDEGQPEAPQEGDDSLSLDPVESARLDDEERAVNSHKFSSGEMVKYVVDRKLETDWRVVGYPEKRTPDIYVRIIKNGEERWPKEDTLWRMQSLEAGNNTAAQEELVKKYFGEPVKIMLNDGKVIEGKFAGINPEDGWVYLEYQDGNNFERKKVHPEQFESWQAFKTEEELDAENPRKNTEHETDAENPREDEEDEPDDEDLAVTPEDIQEPKKRSKRVFETLGKAKKKAAFPARVMLGDKIVDFPGDMRKASQKVYAKAGAGTYLALAKWFDAEDASEQERSKKKYRRRIYTIIGIGTVVAADYFWHEPYHSRLLKPPEDPSNLLPPFLR